MNTDHLLDGVLGPAPDDPRFAASLAATLKAARGRRYRRQTARGAALAVVLLAGWAGWRGTSPQPATERRAGIAVPAAVEERQPGFVRIESAPMPAAFLLETRTDSVVSFSTKPGKTVEWITDDELLALAPGCLALTRSARGMEFVALCDDLIRSP